MFVIAPTINLNGTSGRTLLDQQIDAITALRAAIEAMQAAAPNGRDYQTMPKGTIDLAVAGHVDRLKRIEGVIDELGEIAESIASQIANH